MALEMLIVRESIAEPFPRRFSQEVGVVGVSSNSACLGRKELISRHVVTSDHGQQVSIFSSNPDQIGTRRQIGQQA
jgi:hypothetical protein